MSHSGICELPYVGRFAPSPTGPLHFGSLLAALGSYLQARSADGTWLVRMEDLDPPREVAGSADSILRTLDLFGLHWDREVLYQNTRLDAYREAIEVLLAGDQAYRCRCTRRIVSAQPGGIYTGLCRRLQVSSAEDHAIRMLTDNQPVGFDDTVQGRYLQRLESEVGDYVVQRRDGLYAYQLAVTVDDEYQGITDIVRGCDLLDSTPRQIHLRTSLGLSQPTYAHLPVALDQAGNKLSKQTSAAALPVADPSRIMFDALVVLRQQPPSEMCRASPSEQLDWAIKNWNINRLQSIAAVILDDKRKLLQTRHEPVAMQQFED